MLWRFSIASAIVSLPDPPHNGWDQSRVRTSENAGTRGSHIFTCYRRRGQSGSRVIMWGRGIMLLELGVGVAI